MKTVNQDTANTFNDYFGSTVEKVAIFQWVEHSGDLNSKNHPRCKKIKQHFRQRDTFSFSRVIFDEVKEVIGNSKHEQAAGSEVPVKILKKCE